MKFSDIVFIIMLQTQTHTHKHWIFFSLLDHRHVGIHFREHDKTSYPTISKSLPRQDVVFRQTAGQLFINLILFSWIVKIFSLSFFFKSLIFFIFLCLVWLLSAKWNKKTDENSVFFFDLVMYHLKICQPTMLTIEVLLLAEQANRDALYLSSEVLCAPWCGD